MPARVALLLHMHQPDYREPVGHGVLGEPLMPWVRLHACRGYLDVTDRIMAHGVDVTVNVAPSLLEQLAYYASGGTDAWARLAARPAEELSPEEADFIRTRFVCGHPAMRRCSPRYRELEARVGELRRPDELRDLQMWSNLAWMGFTARRRSLVADLVDQDRDFSQEQLEALLGLQHQLCGEVLEGWRRVPSLCCSPATHPILPLLVDFSHARRSLPHIPDEVDFRHPDDALRQLREGRAICERHLGRSPDGLWPSEGSVSPEVLELVEQAGYRWLATDEGVLRQSERDGPVRVTGAWTHGALRVVFRERALSDRIGFRYASELPRVAVADLLAGADAVVASQGGDTVPVILDGENPWESFPDAGEGFLDALFSSGRVTGVEAMAERPAVGRIQHLHTGSWINADLAIWAGDDEDRRAWKALARVRRAWEQAGRPEAAWPHLAAAEGSDWFWWFGPEFDTPVADLFAELFYAHLAAAEEVVRHAGEVLEEADEADSEGPHSALRHLAPDASWTEARVIPTVTGGSQASGNDVVRHGLVVPQGDTLVVALVPRWGDHQGGELELELQGLGRARVRFSPRSQAEAFEPVEVGGTVRNVSGSWVEDRVVLLVASRGLRNHPLQVALGLHLDGVGPRRHPRQGWLSLPLVPSATL